MEILKIAALFTLFLFLIIKKIDLGLTLLFVSFCLGIFYHLGFPAIGKVVLKASIDKNTVELILTIFFILILGEFLEKSGAFKTMIKSLDELSPDPRLTLAIPPAFIGLLPMPGGAMFSAPMVEAASKKFKITGSEKTYFNFWFRHIWEYTWPLYPGLIVAAAVLKIPVQNIIKHQYFYAIVAIAGGIIFGLRNIKPDNKNEIVNQKDVRTAVKNLLISMLPVWLILIFNVGFGISIVAVLSFIILFYMFFPQGVTKKKLHNIDSDGTSLTRSKFRKFFLRNMPVFVKVFSLKMVLLLISVMVFKEMLQASGAMEAVPAAISHWNISLVFPMFLIPFIVGILTGVNQLYAGVAYPLLLPFLINATHVDFRAITFVYVSGFAGVLLSPLHLCLSLTKEYFKGNWLSIYRMLIKPVVLVILVAIIQYFVGN